jgi:hypothetical protein
MAGFGGAPSGFAAGVTAATGFLCGVFVIAVLAVGLRAGGFGATATGMAGFGGAASGFAAGVTAATGFLYGVFVIAVLAVGLRAADLTTLALLAGALAAGARLAAIVLADFFAAGFFVVFFAAATFFVFFVFFAIFVFPIVVADFPNHTGSACNGTARLSTQLVPIGCIGPADLWRSQRSGCSPILLLRRRSTTLRSGLFEH